MSSSKSGKYIPSRDYGTRGSERDKQRILFGGYRATIYRRAGVESDTYNFRVYIKGERKQIRRSLGTADKGEALRKAESELIAILASVKAGQKVVSPSLREMFREYRKHLESRVAAGKLAAITLRNTMRWLRLGEEFIGRTRINNSVSKLSGDEWDRYLAFREQMSPGINQYVVNTELVIIRAAFKWAMDDKGWCGREQIPRWSFEPPKNSQPKRARLASNEWGRLVKLSRDFANRREGSEAEIYYRKLLHHLYLVLGASGMRSHECQKLRHRDIELHRDKNECVVNIPAAISKVRKPRTITINPSFGGSEHQNKAINYLIRLVDEVCRHKEPDDFLFASFTSGAKSGANSIYEASKKFREEVLNQEGLGHIEFTHGRHTFITMRLLAGEPIHLVARVCGTSTDQIESTYSQVLSELVSRQFGKKRVSVSDQGYEIIEGQEVSRE